MKKSLRVQLGEYALFVLPTCLCLIVVELIPFINGIFYSLTDWNGISSEFNFVGLQNYVSSLQPGGEYLSYFGVSICFMLTIVPVSNMLAIVLANLLDTPRLATRKVSRVVLFMPYVLSSVVVVYLWRFVFTSCFDGIGKALGCELLRASWLSDRTLAFWSIVIVSVWSNVGFLTMIYTAGLQNIDRSLMEASMIDGATAIQQFFRVKLPLLMSSVTICLFLSISYALNIFELPKLLTVGGPAGATTTPAVNIYNVAYETRKFGLGVARSILLFLFVLFITMIQTHFTGKHEQQI